MIIAIAAMSINGKIATSKEDNTSWTSKEDKRFFSKATKQAGVVIFGRTTWETINRPLPDRHLVIMSHTPQTSEFETVEFSNLSPQQLIAELTNRGFQDICVAGGQQIYTAFLNAKLIDQLWLTIEPHLFDTSAISLFSQVTVKPILQLQESSNLTPNTLQLKYSVSYE